MGKSTMISDLNIKKRDDKDDEVIVNEVIDDIKTEQVEPKVIYKNIDTLELRQQMMMQQMLHEQQMREKMMETERMQQDLRKKETAGFPISQIQRILEIYNDEKMYGILIVFVYVTLSQIKVDEIFRIEKIDVIRNYPIINIIIKGILLALCIIQIRRIL